MCVCIVLANEWEILCHVIGNVMYPLGILRTFQHTKHWVEVGLNKGKGTQSSIMHPVYIRRRTHEKGCIHTLCVSTTVIYSTLELAQYRLY